MRNSQLDSSVPRFRRGGDPELPVAWDTPVPVRRLPPILATLGGAVLLVLLFAALTYITLNGVLSSVAPDAGPLQDHLLSTSACGVITLALAAATLYFLNGVRVAVGDLAARPVMLEGRIAQKHTGRGRAGGHWIVVRPAGAAEPAPTPSAPALSVALRGDEGPAPALRERGFVRGGGSSFGAQLQGAATGPRVAPAPAAGAGLTLPAAREKLAPGDVNLRIEKRMYEALALGDRVQVVYSPHLEHVYYVKKRSESGSALVLRNPTLI